MNGQPAGNPRRRRGLARHVVGWSDPSGGLNWAMSISDQTARNDALERLSREIMYRNPPTAMNILTAAGVPPNLIPQPGQGGGQGGQGGRGGGRRGGGP